MDPRRNPYAPGAGTRPTELAGRDAVIETVEVALDRVRQGRSAQLHMLIGLRGVGKTVLLDELNLRAEDRGFACLKLEAPEGRSLPALIVPGLRTALLRLDRGQAAMSAAKRALGALRNFATAFKLGYGEFEASVVPAETGVADSGNLDLDLADLLVEVGLAARERKTAFVMFIDELQYVPQRDLASLIAALHQIGQRRRPVTLVGAGLPQIVGLVGRAKSYAERMFAFEHIAQLSDRAARDALVVPAREEGVEIDADALDELIAITGRYPYFLQQWGSQAWLTAEAAPIRMDDVRAATPTAMAALDQNFFRVRFDRLTPSERIYLRAMAGLGDGPARSADVAASLDRTTNAAGPVRDSLIRKGMLYSPELGVLDFTVPLFGDFMRRAMP
ncbi:MAG: AAA family ATPase [Caulobacteraceae bacterium]